MGDSADAQKALRDTEKAIQQTEQVTRKSGKSMKGVWGTVAAAMLACVRSAAMLESSTNALNVIFGDQADEMLDWAEGMAQYGLSTAQAAGAAAVMGAQLKNAGLSAEQMTVVTQGLVETSTQLATVMGGSAVDAIGAMGAAMRGEFDSLERYGITLTADMVATEAARLAAEGYTFASEQQGKMVATVSLIQQQATAIMGEAEGQTVTMKTSTDHLKASIGNLAATIGGPLLGILAPLIETLADVIDKIVTFWNESETLQAILDVLAGILQTVADIVNTLLVPVLDVLNGVLETLGDLIDRFVTPILETLSDVLDTVAGALETVVGIVQDAVNWFDNFTDSVHEAIDALTFWNDTYDPNADSMSALSAPTLARQGVAGYAGAGATRATNVNITIEGVTDPYSAARVMTRALERYSIIQGRKVGMPLAEAW